MPANFSCDIEGGSTTVYTLGSKEEIDPTVKIQNKLDTLFTLGQTNGQIPPQSDTTVMFQFKPTDCFQNKYG